MQIIFPLKDFSYNIFPDLKKFSDNIESNTESIKDFLISFYTFGPFIPEVKIENDIVTIDINTENIDKYYDEYQNALNLCEKGKFRDAKPILEKLIKLNPTVSEFYRVYGQILESEGNYNEAKDYLIDSLRWDPRNKYALLMLGNIFARQDDDIETANKFYNEALALNPEDHIALNNIGANLAKLEKYDDAERYLNLALEINETYPNTYYGLALIFDKKGEYLKSFDYAIQALKLSINKDNIIYQHSFNLASNSAYEYIKNDKKIKDIIDGFKLKVQSDGGVEIRIEESKNINFPASTQYAENYKRDYHLILFKPDFPAFPHLILHELAHIDFANKSRKAGTYKIFTTKNEHKELFIRNCEKQINSLNKSGIPERNIIDFINSLFHGLSSQIYNAPIDLFIENFLYNDFPENRPYQFFALQLLQKSYLEGIKKEEIKKYTPKFVKDANNIYNIIHAMQFSEFYGYDLTNKYEDLIFYKAVVNKLYNHFVEVENNFTSGDEYNLVDKWGKELRLNKYYELKEKIVQNKTSDNLNYVLSQIEKDPLNIDSSNREESLKRVSFKDNPAGSMAVTMYCLDALQYFDGKDSDYIQEVTFEIAMLGTYGLNPYNNEKKYSLKNIPDKEFTALHLLSYEYVGFQIINPELDTQLDFQNEYESAKQMFNK